MTGAPPIWLDHFAYSGRLLAAGTIPWFDPGAFLAYYRQAHTLLQPGVAMIPLERFFDAWLNADSSLIAEMARKRRVGFALKALLAAEAPRASLIDIVRAVRDSFASVPLVMAIPSPRRWLPWAHARAYGLADLTEVEVGGDDVELAAMYVADFLRTFADARVDALLLEETPAHGPQSAEEVSWYRPVVNVAKHYRWEVGIKIPAYLHPKPPSREEGGGEGIDFWITDAGMPTGVTGLILGDAFWSGESAPPLSGTGFYFARVPEDAVPERVLERLGTLRS